jgi:hypothetical protein
MLLLMLLPPLLLSPLPLLSLLPPLPMLLSLRCAAVVVFATAGLVCACPRYAVVLVWLLFVLARACLAFVCTCSAFICARLGSFMLVWLSFTLVWAYSCSFGLVHAGSCLFIPLFCVCIKYKVSAYIMSPYSPLYHKLSTCIRTID